MDDAIEVLAALVRVDSVNPDLVPGGAGEAEIAELCAGWLGRRGFEVHRLERRPGRPSIVGIARGTGGGRSLMLNGHLDTVTLAGYDGDPLDPQLRDGSLHGRGAYDMKSGLAAMMVAAAAATADGTLRGDVLVACVADEEYASAGTEEVLERFTADGGIVSEPSDLELTLAHKGFAWFDVEIIGVAHLVEAGLGVNAIAKAGHLLVALERWQQRLAASPGHPRLGPPSVHASMISGGEEASSYPARCRITLEYRCVPGESADSVEAELRAILAEIAGRVGDFRHRVVRGLFRQPFEADPDGPLVTTLRSQAARVLGRDPVIRAEPFWTDCALLAAAGIPCALFGVGGGGAHAATEWVDLASLAQVTAVLEATVREFCA